MRKLKIIKNSKVVKTVEDWFLLAPPEKKEEQWKDDHSAKELAKYFLNYKDFIPPEIDEYLNEIGIISNSFIAEPECETSLTEFGFGKKGSRKHDVFLFEENKKEVVIGIEAKATEDLDKFVTDKGSKPLTSNQIKRYYGLCEKLLGKNFEDCSKIRYQLLSATGGTLIEAKKRKLNKAVFLILLFKTQLVTDEHINSTINDINEFTSLLKVNDNGSYSCINFMSEIYLYIKYLIIDSSSYNS